MNWITAGVLAIAVGSGTAVIAQQGTAGQSRAVATITVSGCVERADQLAAAGSTAQVLDTDSLSFVLMRASRSASAAPAPVGTSGAADAPIGNAYWLEAPADKLTAHVGHEVEITGVASAGVQAGTSTALPAGTPQRNGDTNPLANAPRLKVDAITTIAETCKR